MKQQTTFKTRQIAREAVLLAPLIAILLLFPAGRSDGKASKETSAAMVLIEAADRPSIKDDYDPASINIALRRSLEYYKTLPNDHTQRFGRDFFTQRQMIETLEVAIILLETSKKFGDPLDLSFHELFRFYRASGSKGDGSVLFTGYYEPVVSGSLARSEGFDCPLYGVPEEIRKHARETSRAPFFTRQEIERDRRLAGRGLEIAWLRDPIDLFFLQIQGSGRISLPGGSIMRVGYAASNGHPYSSIGKYLISRRKIKKDEATLSGIKRYLRTHPEETESILWINKRYIFFQETAHGPTGNIAVPLTPGRSIAMDAHLFPKGALAYFETEIPVIDSLGKITGWKMTSRLAMIQDTGSAIQGPGRVDIFFGSGREAEEKAGTMMRKGRLYLLVLK